MAKIYVLNTTKKFGNNARKGEMEYLVNGIYKDGVREFSLTNENGKTVMVNLTSKSLAGTYNSGDRAKLSRQLQALFNATKGTDSEKKAQKFANKTVTSNKKKVVAKFIVLPENRQTVYDEMANRGFVGFDREVYETVAKELGLWVKNPNN